MKRFKSQGSSFREELALGGGSDAELYLGHEHTRMAALGDAPRGLKQEKQDHVRT